MYGITMQNGYTSSGSDVTYETDRMERVADTLGELRVLYVSVKTVQSLTWNLQRTHCFCLHSIMLGIESGNSQGWQWSGADASDL